MFFSKNYLTRIFLFFVSSKFHAFYDTEKFRENSYLEKKKFYVIFKLLLFHQFFKLLSV